LQEDGFHSTIAPSRLMIRLARLVAQLCIRRVNSMRLPSPNP
jgi:hypothetical protein